MKIEYGHGFSNQEAVAKMEELLNKTYVDYFGPSSLLFRDMSGSTLNYLLITPEGKTLSGIVSATEGKVKITGRLFPADRSIEKKLEEHVDRQIAENSFWKMQPLVRLQ